MENNNLEIEKINKYKDKYRKSLIFIIVSNLLILGLTSLIMAYNDILFSVIGNIFITKNNFHSGDIEYIEKVGLFAIVIYFSIFAILLLSYYLCQKLLKLETEDIVWFVVGGTKNEHEYQELYNQEKHKYSRNGKIIYVLKNILDYLRIINLAILTVILIFTFILFPAEVNQSSMEPNLYEGNRVIVVITKKVKKNDIVVFQYDNNIQLKNSALNEDLLIKRVIATSGDTFNCVSGKIYLNGELLEEDYVNLYNIDHDTYNLIDIASRNSNKDELLELISKNGGKVPDGYILCLGDNRAISNDSENFGLVKISQLLGKVKYYKNDFGWKKIEN